MQESALNGYIAVAQQTIITMSKSHIFFRRPKFGQLIKSLDREKIVEICRKHGGDKYVKSFHGYTHLLTMLYAVILRFDSLPDIKTSMTAEVRHCTMSELILYQMHTLSDANAPRSQNSFKMSIAICKPPKRNSFLRQPTLLNRRLKKTA